MPQAKFDPKEVSGYECHNAIHCPPKDWTLPELHLVKEMVHMKDGTIVPNIRFIKDYQRPFWIANKGSRRYTQKREREKLDNLMLFKSTQRDLVRNIARAMGNPGFRGSLKQICRSPYVYGADPLSTTVLKHDYQTRFPGLNSFYTVCALDIETDMYRGTGEIYMCTVTMGSKVYTVIQHKYFEGHINIEERLRECMAQYLGTVVERRKIEWELKFVDTPAQVVVESVKKAHEWMPDFLAIWNMDFDVPKMVAALEAEDIDPADVFSDPAVPKTHRYWKYVQGPSQKVTASGKMMPLPPAQRWHTVFVPASFYIIDSMCVYWQLRNQEQKKQSYSLAAILKEELADTIKDENLRRGKLGFDAADHLSGADWHVFMQTQYPFEYVIYNCYDTIGMLDLDDKTKDLSIAMPSSCGASDFRQFKSQPRRLANSFHFKSLKDGFVMATTSDDMHHELDKYVIGRDGWIIALQAYLIHENGIRVILDGESLLTSIYIHVADLDVSAAYPTNEMVCNISQQTTARELATITGVSELTRRMQGINLAGGHVNAVEFGVTMLGLPDMDTMLAAYEGREIPHYARSQIIITRSVSDARENDAA